MIDHKETGLPARVLRRLSRMLGGWAPSRNGAVAPMFAVLAGVLLLGAGVGMDLSRVTSSRNQLQDAIDAAGLALARMPSTSDMDTVLKPAAQNWVRANLHGTTLNPDDVTVTLTRNANGVQISAVTNVQPTLAGVAHIGPFAVTATSIVKYQVNQVEVALVLDNTGSMGQVLDGSQTKIQVLKQAAQNLVDTLMTPANAGGVKIGVVPYAEYVNVGMANRNAPWMNVAADTSTTTHYPDTGTKKTCTTKTTNQCTGGVYNNNCGTTTTYKDGVPSQSTYGCWTTPQTCNQVTTNVAPYECGNFVAAHDTTTTVKWFGCAKYQLLGLQLALPDPAGAYTGIMETNVSNSHYCLSEILPMTGDKSVVSSTISGLITSRPGYSDPSTYIPGGLHWGINLLSPAAPFQEGAPYDAKNLRPRKALILMTDGANTKFLNATTPGLLNPTSTSSTPSAVQLAPTYLDQGRMCDYAKQMNIEVYTIGFGVNDPTSLAALKSCAKDASHYFDAQSSDGLLNAFKVIAGSLSNLRIAH